MTNNRRISVSLTPVLEKRVMEMRKTDEFCMMSVAEIIRILIARGLEEENEQVSDIYERPEAHLAAEEGHRPSEQAAEGDAGKPDLLRGRHDRGAADSFTSADGVMGRERERR